MAKLRKMLGDINAPYIISLMRLIETQSKATLVNWSINYTEEHILPIYENAYQSDTRPRNALNAAREWMDGKIKLPAVKKLILDAHAAAREAEGNPVAQAAARTAGQAAATIHVPTHSLGLAFYGTEECGKIEAALRAVAVPDEPNPAKINWNC